MLPVDLREIKIAGDVHIRNSAVVTKFVDLLLHCSDEVFELSCMESGGRYTAAIMMCFDSL